MNKTNESTELASREGLNIECIDLKFSKEDLAAVAIDEYEDFLNDERKRLKARERVLVDEQSEALQTFNEKMAALPEALLKDQITRFKKFVKDEAGPTPGVVCVEINNSCYNSRKNIVLTWGFAKYSWIDEQLSKDYSAERSKLDKQLRESLLVPTGNRLREVSLELQELDLKIKNIPKMEKKFKAELARKALSATAGGKGVLEVLKNKVEAIKALKD